MSDDLSADDVIVQPASMHFVSLDAKGWGEGGLVGCSSWKLLGRVPKSLQMADLVFTVCIAVCQAHSVYFSL